jgi:transposase
MNNITYLGVDFHPYQQTIAFVDKFGEIKTRSFDHTDKSALRKFYQQFPNGTIVGVEASQSFQWFENLLFELHFELRIGNPTAIRKMAISPHKSDKLDAQHILDLLLSNRFPAVAPRSEKSRMILAWLNYRDSLVRQRTMIGNQLHAMARNFGLPRFQSQAKSAKSRMLGATDSADWLFLINSRFTCLENLTKEINLLEAKLRQEANQDERAKLLQTHSGIGALTALCVVHTLGDVRRFARPEQVTAFVGLAPLNKSSGERNRIGKISKHGSRLLRFLLGQAAQSSKDERLKSFYHRVSRRRGTPKAKVATARKLLVNCYLMLRDNIDYEEFRRRGEVGLPGKPGKLSAI